MRMLSTGREVVRYKIRTDVTFVGAWQISLDDGVTWTAGTLVSGRWQWLINGPDCALPPVAGMVTARPGITRPQLRADSYPERVIRHAPRITIVG